MEPKLPEANKTATVKLIQATRLPVNHVKLVRASVGNSELIGSVCLFEPDLSRLHQKEITMSDELVNGEKTVTLLVNNQGAEPVQLEADSIISQLNVARVVKVPDVDDIAQHDCETGTWEDNILGKEPMIAKHLPRE